MHRHSQSQGSVEFLKGDQIADWKKQFLEHATEVFGKDQSTDQGPNIKDLHAKTGQLSMENDFLSSALGRISGVSAKK